MNSNRIVTSTTFLTKNKHHCRYYSGSYTEPQIKWEINRKELFALYKCLLAFEPYIVYNKFIVRTDNTQVKWWINVGVEAELSREKRVEGKVVFY